MNPEISTRFSDDESAPRENRRSRKSSHMEEHQGADDTDRFTELMKRVENQLADGCHADIGPALAELEQHLSSDNREAQLRATIKIRNLMTVDKDLLVQEVIDRNIIPVLIKFLEDRSAPSLQVEALWALTNIAAGTAEQIHLLIKNNAIPTLVSLLNSENDEILEQAIWVLGNIADDGIVARDKVLQAGVLRPLMLCMRRTKKVPLLRIASWTLSHLCDGQPRPALPTIKILDTIKAVLASEDTEILSYICWSLSHLCDGPSPHIRFVVQENICPRLIELLHHKSWRVVKPALRTIGNIVCAEEDQDYTQHVIECGAVPCLTELIKHQNKEIQKEACWTLSNIAAGTVDQIQHVLDSGCIKPLVELASQDVDTDGDVRIEACWVLLNATSCGSNQQIKQLVQAGCVSVLCDLLSDHSMVMMALEGLEKILQVGEDFPTDGSNSHACLINTAKVDALQQHRSPAISKRATRMWKHYFVVCAICNAAYSKNSPQLHYCEECKCNVCRACNCAIYHLSYQDQLWKSISEGEANLLKAKQQGKKSKKAKKKEKEKEKEKKKKEKQSLPPKVPLTEKEIDEKTLAMLRLAEEDNNETSHEDYVEFLSNNGSILDLWKMIDENESKRTQEETVE